MAAESDASASAERIVRLEQDLAEAKEQLTATNDVLAVIGRSDFRLEPVFETVVRHAAPCVAPTAGTSTSLTATSSASHPCSGARPSTARTCVSTRFHRGRRRSLAGLAWSAVLCRSRTSLRTPPIGGRSDAAGALPHLGAPMLAGDRVVGVLTLWRLKVDPFDDRTIALLTACCASGGRDPER